jgi:hypothetical protein
MSQVKYCAKPFTLKEKNRLRLIENKTLSKIFRPKRDEVKEEWRTLHNENLHDLQSSPDINRVTKSIKNYMSAE